MADPSAVRAELRRVTAPSLAVALEDVHHDDARGTEHFRVVRLFRRHVGRYAGRLHEQAVDGITGRPLPTGQLDAVTLCPPRLHPGAVHAKDKLARNARLAELALHDGVPTYEVYFNLARSYSAAGDLDAAVEPPAPLWLRRQRRNARS